MHSHVYYLMINDPNDLTPSGSGVVRPLNYMTIFSITEIALKKTFIIGFILVLIHLTLTLLFRIQNIKITPI